MTGNTDFTAGNARQAQRVRMLAARFCGVAARELELVERPGSQMALARQLAMYLANRVYRLSHAQTAAMFGRERDAASYACRRIEALREDPRFDWQVFEVETLLRAAEVYARESRCEEVRV
jgi:chromosomal replication initiation ATPase DnaA